LQGLATTGNEKSELYAQAEAAADEQEFIVDRALACEAAARHYIEAGREKEAGEKLFLARYCYEKWGCGPKVDMLNAQYGRYLSGLKESRTIHHTHNMEDNDGNA
jgi:hypothetical protein